VVDASGWRRISVTHVRRSFTHRQRRAADVSNARAYLRDGERLVRVVHAATVARLWSLASVELIGVLLLTRLITHFPSRVVGFVVVLAAALFGQVALHVTRWREIFVTSERVLVCDERQFSATSPVDALYEGAPTDLAATHFARWRRFALHGEHLYFLSSYEFGPTEVVGHRGERAPVSLANPPERSS
jgi:hypothetical protein